jgi:hypothetical protein
MKKSISALAAAAVVGGLGLATSAQAVVYFNDYGWSAPGTSNTYGSLGTTEHSIIGSIGMTAGGQPPGAPAGTTFQAKSLELNLGATGHVLIVPYYSAQPNTGTSLSIVNTDSVDGKVVKVRFRGAANADDVLDFTVFLSPGDVWTAALNVDNNGMAQLTTNDSSCTQPVIGQTGASFFTDRLPAYLTAAQQAANTREGYVEILNMADVPPHISNGASNPLYTAIKHVNDAPPCTDAPLAALLDQNTNASAQELLDQYGLDTPTGGLFGSWAVINQNTLGAFSGADTAVRAIALAAAPADYASVYGGGDTKKVTPVSDTASVNGYTFVAYSPQDKQAYDDYQGPGAGHALGNNLIWNTTADPLLTGITARKTAAVSALRFDVPDLSTPLLPRTQGLPTNQAYAVSTALGRVQIRNEFAVSPNGAVPFNTDWVLSQPTRRYFAAVDYGANLSGATILYNDNLRSGCVDQGTFAATFVPGQTAAAQALPYWDKADSNYWSADCATRDAGALITATASTGILQLIQSPNGPVARLPGVIYMYNREEVTPISTFVSSPYNFYAAGDVATMTFGNSPLNASLTNTPTTGAPETGWATFTPVVGTGGFIPILGYSGIAGSNVSTNITFGETLAHRW